MSPHADDRGFATGAIVGAKIAPLALQDGQDSDFALVLALPAALLCGAPVAAAVERWAFGPTTDTLRGMIANIRSTSRLRRGLAGRLITSFRARVESGSSGGPVVDTHGRVLATVFGGRGTADGGLGVRTGPCAPRCDARAHPWTRVVRGSLLRGLNGSLGSRSREPDR